MLNSYIADLEASGQSTVTAANAVAWATRPAGTSAVWHSRRLSVARCFARYLSATDPHCQVPPAWLLPARYSRDELRMRQAPQVDQQRDKGPPAGGPL